MARKPRIFVKIPATKKIDKQQDKEIRKLKKDVRLLKGSNESKHLDKEITFATYTQSTSNVDTLNDMAQGDADIQRVGDEAVMIHLSGKFVLVGETDEVVTSRVIIMIDKQNIFTDHTTFMAASGGANDVNAYIDWDKKKQLQILLDRRYTSNVGNLVDGSVTSAPFAMERTLSYSINLRNKKVVFQGGGQTINVNALKIFVFSNSSTTGPQITGFFRLTFRG